MDTVFGAGFALEALPVKPHVPIGQLLDKLEQFRHDAVEVVSFHLGLDALDQRLAVAQDPLVHNVLAFAHQRLVVHEDCSRVALMSPNILNQKPKKNKR